MSIRIHQHPVRVAFPRGAVHRSVRAILSSWLLLTLSACVSTGDTPDGDVPPEVSQASCPERSASAGLWSRDPLREAKIDAFCSLSPSFRWCFDKHLRQRRPGAVVEPNYGDLFERCRELLAAGDDEAATLIWGIRVSNR